MATAVDDEWEYTPPKTQDDEWEYEEPLKAGDPYAPESIAAAQRFSDKRRLTDEQMLRAEAERRGEALLASPRAAAQRGLQDVAEGIGELGLKAGNLVGAVDDETLAAYRQQADAGRAEFDERFKDVPTGIMRGAYNAAPFMMAPASAARTFLGKLGTNAGIGAGIGAAQYTGEKGSTADNMAIGAALGAIPTAAIGAWNKLRPHNLVANRVNKAMGSDFAREGEALEKATGIRMTPGQITGDKGILTMEGLARQHPISSGRVQVDVDEPQLQQAVQKLNKLMDKIDTRGFGPSQVGNDIKQAFDGALHKAMDIRRAQAAKDYGAIKLSTNKQPVVGTTNIRKEIDDIVSEFDVPGGESIVSQAKAFAKMIGRDPMTAEKAMKARSLYSSMSRGTGQIFKDIDKAQSRMLASRLEAALTRDLEAAETAGGNLGKALKAANSNYRANSLAIEELEKSSLGRLFGGKYDPDPQAVAEKMLKMKPTEMSTAAGILHSSNPKVMQGVKRFALEKAMEKAIPPPSAGAMTPFSAAKFVSALPDEGFMRAVYSPQEVAEIKTLAKALERIANRGGTGGSQTAPLMMAWDAAKAVFSLNIPALTRLGVSTIAPNRIADAMASKHGRQAIRTLIETRDPQKAMRAAAFLATRQEETTAKE